MIFVGAPSCTIESLRDCTPANRYALGMLNFSILSDYSVSKRVLGTIVSCSPLSDRNTKFLIPSSSFEIVTMELIVAGNSEAEGAASMYSAVCDPCLFSLRVSPLLLAKMN